MRLEMGLYWCEVLIKGLLAKRVQQKLAPFGVGIAFTGSISALLLQSRYVDAAPCCTKANAVTSTSLSEASEESKNPIRNIQSLKETGGLEQDSSTVPTLPFENGYSPRRFGNGYAEGKPLLYPSVSPPEYEYKNAFSTKTLSALSSAAIFPLQSSFAGLHPASSLRAATLSLTRAIASDVRSIKNGQPSSASLVVLDDLQALEQDSLSCLSQVGDCKQASGNEELPHPASVSKAASGLLAKEEQVSQDSLLRVEDFSPSALASLSPSKLMLLKGESFTPEIFLPAQVPNVPPPALSQNLQPNPNQERFLQSPSTPAPLTPDLNQPAQPLPTPRVEIPDSTSPTQPPSTPTPQPSPTPAPTQPSPTPTPTTQPNVQTIQVQKIKVTRSTVFSPDQLNPIVQPYEGRTLTLEQLREVADKITQLYLDRGYITSRAILVDQTFTDGVVEIAVVEGSLEDIKVEGTRRVKPGYIRSRVQLGAGKPLNTGKLEDQLRLLRADPLFENVEASLRAGTGVGQSILIVRVVEANPFEGSVGIDNYSPPSVGSERLGLNLLYRNLTGHGDEIAASYYHTTTSGADSFDFSYRIPLNPMNGSLQLRAAPSRNKITQESSRFLGIRGQSELYEIRFRQPLIRSPREEFALSLGFTYQEGQTFIFNDVPFAFGIG